MTLPRLPALMGAAMLLCSSAAFAASQAPSALQQERAACARLPEESRSACEREAGAAAQAARSGDLSSMDASTYERNALARCDAFQTPQDKAECHCRSSPCMTL